MSLIDLATDDRLIVAVNQALVELHGHAPESLVGQPVSLILADGESLAAEPADGSRDDCGRTVIDQVVRGVRSDGEPLWLRLHASPLRTVDGRCC